MLGTPTRPLRSTATLLVAVAALVHGVAQAELRLVEESYISQGVDYGGFVVFDSDHDGAAELLTSTLFRDIRRIGVGVYEWVGPDSIAYVYGDTGDANAMGIETGNLVVHAVGYLDSDSSSDLVGANGEYTTQRNYLLVCQHEGPAATSYPDSMVWHARVDSGAIYTGQPTYLADLDRDGRAEVVFIRARVYVYENDGDNSCRLATNSILNPGCLGWLAFGDLDGNGRTEFAGAQLSLPQMVYFWESVGNDSIAVVESLEFNYPNGHDIWSGNDVDRNGRPEFFVAFALYRGGWWMYLYQVEAVADNRYQSWFVDSARCTASDWSRQSRCGDIDGDGIDEVVWSIGSHLRVYRATGPNRFECIQSRPCHSWCSDVVLYDVNRDGYNDIVVSGNNESYSLALEAVRVLSPAGGEVLRPGDSVTIVWQTFQPPRCDSARVLLSLDDGRNYGLLGTVVGDTTLPWVVPGTPSDSCLVKVEAYGPGVRADVSDAVFHIVSAGVGEAPLGHIPAGTLVAWPNPLTTETWLTTGPRPAGTRLQVFDCYGAAVRDLSPRLARANQSVCWDRRDDTDRPVASGVYVVRLQTGGRALTRKLVVR